MNHKIQKFIGIPVLSLVLLIGFTIASNGTGSDPYITTVTDVTPRQLNLFASQISIEGDIAYILGQDCYYVYDISDVMHPVWMRTCEIDYYEDQNQELYDNFINSMVVLNGTMYVTAGGNFNIILPRLDGRADMISSIPLECTGTGICIKDGYAYVAGYDDFCILDIDPIGESQIISRIPIPWGTEIVSVADGYAYVNSSETGLYIVDIDPPESAWVVGSLGSRFDGDVCVANGYAYRSTEYNGLEVIDVDPPQSAMIVGNVPLSSPGKILITGNIAYVADQGAGIQVIDISTPETARVVGTIGGPLYQISDMVLKDDHILITSADGILVADLDFSTGATANLVVDDLSFASDVDVQAQYAYIHTLGVLYIADISVPGNCEIINKVTTSCTWGCIEVRGDYAYIASDYRLNVVDVQSAAEAALLADVVTGLNFVSALVVNGDYAYILSHEGVMQVYDISSPSNPELVKELDVPWASYGMYVSGKYAYIASTLENLLIMGIDPLEDPSVISYFETPAGVHSVVVSDGYAYLGCGTAGLQVLDINNPESPVIVGSLTDGYIGDVSISGNNLLAAGLYGLMVIDISDPSKPFLSGEFNLTSQITGMDAAGEYLYLADEFAGFRILRLEVANAPATE
ncbi:MAG: hypothetical protein NTY09_04805 [bacterium]|nr:hypothetical protein [bacterium]